MADTKITGLQTPGAFPVVPSTDVLPIVIVADNSMAASGSTRKVTVNQLLGAGGTATLASATISGDLTVDTSTLKVDSANNRVGVLNAAPNDTFTIASDNYLSFQTASTGFNSGRAARIGAISAGSGNGYLVFETYQGGSGGAERYRIASDGVATWSNVGGVAGTAMTLNSTGLGVGGSPVNPLTVFAATSAKAPALLLSTVGSPTYGWDFSVDGAVNGNLFIRRLVAGTKTDVLEFDRANGNVGIGVTPSAWGSNWKANHVGTVGSFASSGAGSAPPTAMVIGAYNDNTNWKYQFSSTGAARYEMTGANAGSVHAWYTSPGGTVNTNITDFATPKMTLDASGNLLVGTTTNTNVSRIFSRGTATSSALALQGASGDVALAQLTVGKFDNNTTTSQIFVRFTINDNSGGSGQINANGASQAAFGTFSDSRLKENIVSLPSQLANILSLRPVEFDYKDGSGHQIGFVAQEMQEVYSDAVGEQNGFLTVTGWSKTEARLVSAIKELAAKVQALESKLA